MRITISLTADNEEDIKEMLRQVVREFRASRTVRPTSMCLENASRLTLTVNVTETEDDAFLNDPVSEMCRILERLASELTISTDCKLIDLNGNSIGRATMVEHLPGGRIEHDNRSALQQRAEELLAGFRESYLKKVEHLSKSGAVTEEELDFKFLRAVLLLEAESYQPHDSKYKQMLKNLRHF